MELGGHILNDFVGGRMDGFYREAYPSLLTYAARLLGGGYAFLAEDCVQDAICKAYGRRATFETPAHLKSFLYQCVHNAAVSILRRHGSQQRYMGQQATSHDLRASIVEQETLDLLFRAIDRLPGDLRQVFELSFEEGLKNAEVAARMGISESGVKKKKAKMISLLRRQFADNDAVQLLVVLMLGELMS